jgi:hypothetical protein
MKQECQTQPSFNPNYHFPVGATINFADRIVIGSCYSFEPGEELRCRQCGGTHTERISPPGGPIRCADGSVAHDAAVTKCLDCGWAYIWRICLD